MEREEGGRPRSGTVEMSASECSDAVEIANAARRTTIMVLR
jgi:hypothetical protein